MSARPANELPEIRIYRKSGQRTLRMRIVDDHVAVSAPMKLSQVHVEAFISGHTDWIRSKWAEVQLRKNELNAVLEQRKGQVFIRGEWRTLAPLNVGGRGIELVEMPEKVVLKYPGGKWSRTMVTKGLMELARRELPKDVKRLSVLTGIGYKDVTVRSQKSRWGSCSSSGALNLNWRLVKCPPMVRDYVILHELAHTRVFNHSKAFWDLVHKLMPEYRTALEWVSAYSSLVFADEPGPP